MTQEKGRGNSCRWKGWWKRGDVKPKASAWSMSCWVYATARYDSGRRQLEEAISSDTKKDQFKMALSGEESNF